ncbi:hypothetical protein [Aquimarina aggregata]|uniref:hypothetical protein n=1 Tax=Aquimarina aggregata TaxID=1642818 RepID=UPI002492F68D|nr:hypothetical protein [Aquimarina aggregata]
MLEVKYPFLFQFLTGYFSSADLDNLNDQEVVKSFFSENPFDIINQTQKELNIIIEDTSILAEIGIEANKYFKNDDETISWVKSIAQSFTNELS